MRLHWYLNLCWINLGTAGASLCTYFLSGGLFQGPLELEFQYHFFNLVFCRFWKHPFDCFCLVREHVTLHNINEIMNHLFALLRKHGSNTLEYLIIYLLLSVKSWIHVNRVGIKISSSTSMILLSFWECAHILSHWCSSSVMISNCAIKWTH